MTLQPNEADLATFVDCLFRYADEGSYASMRCFLQLRVGTPPYIRGVKLNGSGHSAIVKEAILGARFAANYAEPLVFAPPISTFARPDKASEEALANGLCISVEIDSGNTRDAVEKLEGLIGQATIVVASGGEWADLDTGEVFPKLHAHWRLSEPTRDAADHAKLKFARQLACALVNADPTAKTSVHPLRWPGSVHLKSTPKLARIVSIHQDAEVHLDGALEALEQASEMAGLADDGDTRKATSGPPRGAIRQIESALGAIPNPDEHWDVWIKIGLLTYAATGGSDAGLAAWETWSRKSKAKFVDGACEERWDHFRLHPPTRGGAGTLFFLAEAEGWKRTYFGMDPESDEGSSGGKDGTAEEADQQQSESAGPGKTGDNDREHHEEWPDPVAFLDVANVMGAPELRPEWLPAGISDFVFDTAGRMGVDPSCVALVALVCCASVITDEFQLQPKRFDDTWTEAARLWAAIVAGPAYRKSPILKICTAPIDRLEMDARKRHDEAMREYRTQLGEWKKNGKEGDEPRHPVLDRYMVENLTTEALSEVFRGDTEATQRAPAGKVLVRSDELSELLANLDRYNGGRGGGGDRGAYLRLFNGGRHTVDRIGRGSFACPNWSACIVGGIQPGPIQKIARDAADDGMLQRFLFVVPTRQVPGIDRVPDRIALARYNGLFPCLTALRPARWGTGLQEGLQAIALHADAHQHREALDQLLAALSAMPDTSPRLQAALGKYAGIYARLCLLFHLIDIADAHAAGNLGAPLSVVPEDLARRAFAFVRNCLLPHLSLADALMFLTPQTGHAKWIAGHILSRGFSRVTRRDVTRAYGALRAPEAERELTSVMGGLVTLGWLREEDDRNPARPPVAWVVNPKIHIHFAERAERERTARRAAQEAMAEHIRESNRAKAH